MKAGLVASVLLALSACTSSFAPANVTQVALPPGIAPERLWMNADGFRVKLNDGTTCHGDRPSAQALVADDRPGWSGQLVRCRYLIDYHLVKRDLFGLDALDRVLTTGNILFGTFRNGPNWNLCLIDVPDEAGMPVTRCAAQAIKEG